MLFKRVKFLLAMALLSLGGMAHANIVLVVPFPAGGPTDMVGRIIATELRTVLGTPVIVENRGGAGGTIGAQHVAASKPDGNTILLSTMGSQVVAPLLSETAGYHPFESFDAIAMAGVIQIGLVVNPELPARDLSELIKLADRNEPLTYGSAGVGTTTHIAAEMLNGEAGGKMIHVPYRGGAPAMTDLIGGHIDLYAGDIPTLASYIKAGSIVPLAVLDENRSDLFPDVPTTAELGYPDVVMNNWYGFLTPKGLSPEVHERLENAFMTVLTKPEVQEKMREAGVQGPLGAAEFKQILTDGVERWGPFLKERNITQ